MGGVGVDGVGEGTVFGGSGDGSTLASVTSRQQTGANGDGRLDGDGDGRGDDGEATHADHGIGGGTSGGTSGGISGVIDGGGMGGGGAVQTTTTAMNGMMTLVTFYTTGCLLSSSSRFARRMYVSQSYFSCTRATYSTH